MVGPAAKDPAGPAAAEAAAEVPPALYRVRLHFAEPDDLTPGARVFDVALQGKTVLGGLDVAARAGGPRIARMEEFAGVPVADRLTIGLTARDGSLPPILSGVEVLLEEGGQTP